MSKFLSNIGRWIVTLTILGIGLYFAYLLTIYALWNAPKGVYLFGFICSILIMYFTRNSIRDNGKKYYENNKEMAISFLLYFLIISWLSALAIELFSGYNPAPCYDEFSCDNLPDIPTPWGIWPRVIKSEATLYIYSLPKIFCYKGNALDCQSLALLFSLWLLPS